MEIKVKEELHGTTHKKKDRNKASPAVIERPDVLTQHAGCDGLIYRYAP